MITLTSAPQVQSVLGGNVPVGFEIMALTQANYDMVERVITATLRLRSTSNTQMQPITGTLTIRHTTSEIIIEFTRGVQFHRRLLLSSPQATAVLALFVDAQEAIESGLVALGVVAGTQSAGV